MQGMSEYELLATTDTLIGEMMGSFFLTNFFFYIIITTKVIVIVVIK